MRWLLVAVLLLQGCATDEWSTQDKAMQAGYTAVMLYDMHQTTRIQYDPLLMEGGAIAHAVLGDQPKTSDVWQYAATLAASHWLITHFMPKKWRPYWQTSSLIIHGVAIDHNCAHGLPCPYNKSLSPRVIQ